MSETIDRYLPVSVLIDLYVRIRDEFGCSETSLDPNHQLRASIALAILAAAATTGEDVALLEARVRDALCPASEPLAA